MAPSCLHCVVTGQHVQVLPNVQDGGIVRDAISVCDAHLSRHTLPFAAPVLAAAAHAQTRTDARGAERALWTKCFEAALANQDCASLTLVLNAFVAMARISDDADEIRLSVPEALKQAQGAHSVRGTDPGAGDQARACCETQGSGICCFVSLLAQAQALSADDAPVAMLSRDSVGSGRGVQRVRASVLQGIESGGQEHGQVVTVRENSESATRLSEAELESFRRYVESVQRALPGQCKHDVVLRASLQRMRGIAAEEMRVGSRRGSALLTVCATLQNVIGS